MSFKHLGGVLSPGQEFVCFRCRVGWSGPYTRLARRNVQTESESRSPPLEAILGLTSHPSRDEKSTSEATTPDRPTDSITVRRVRSFRGPLLRLQSAVARKKRQLNSQVAKDALPLLEQKFRNARNARNASSAFRKSAVPLVSSSRRRKRLQENVKKLTGESSYKDQAAITTEKQKTNSTESASRIKAGKDAGKTMAKTARTMAKTARTKGKDSSSNKLTVETKIKKKDSRKQNSKKTVKAAKKKAAETSSRLSSDGTFTDKPLDAVVPARTKIARDNRQTRRKSLKGAEAVSKHENKIQIDEGKIATGRKRKNLSPGYARDRRQDALPAKVLKKEGTVKISRAVSSIVQRRRLKSPELDADQLETFKLNIQTAKAEELHLAPLEIAQAPVPALSYGLDRVLFNPGVYQLQDQRSRVFNFDPYLQTIMPVAEFKFEALKAYITSSKDQTLKSIAEKHGKRYRGSSSSMTAVLSHFHFLLSRFRKVNLRMLSKGFPDKGLDTFTIWQRIPAAIFLMKRDGSYAIDADKEFDNGTILSHLGKAMEKLLTLDTKDYERYRKSNPEKVPTAETEAPESFHYSTLGDLLMRSQLDAHDYRLPGSGMFDLKTRAVVSIRMDARNHHNGLGYEIQSSQGEWESYEREYYDMIRSAFLKYSLQVRMGRMDGIFVAFHNVERIFGFQYISLAEMDVALHGQLNTIIGDEEFKLSLGLLNQILDRATEKFPDSSLRLHFEAREGPSTYMYIFAEPVTDDQAEEIQSTNAATMREFEQTLFRHLPDEPTSMPGQEERCNDWAKIEASVKEAMHSDELSLTNGIPGDDLSSQSVDSYDDKTPYGAAEDNEHVESSNDGQNPTAALDGNAPIEDADNGHDLTMTVDGLLSAENTQELDNSPDLSTIDDGLLSVKNAQELDNSHDLSTTDDGFLSVENAQESNSLAEQDFNVSGDAEFLDSTDKSISAAKLVTVGAWTLSIRNKVNGRYIDRPDKLTSSDKWEVDYALNEITDLSHAQTLYQACQLRRQQQVEKSVEDKDNSKFMRILRELSQLGAERRKKLDEAEKGKPIMTYKSAMVPKDQHEGNIRKRED